MSEKNKTVVHIRIPEETKNKVLNIARELSAIQNQDIHSAEVIRRTFNIPTLPNVLREDALKKRSNR